MGKGDFSPTTTLKPDLFPSAGESQTATNLALTRTSSFCPEVYFSKQACLQNTVYLKHRINASNPHARGPAPGGLLLSARELLSKSREHSSGNDGVRPDGHRRVIKCSLMRSRVTDLGAKLFKQRAKKKTFIACRGRESRLAVLSRGANPPRKGGLCPEQLLVKRQGKRGWVTAARQERSLPRPTQKTAATRNQFQHLGVFFFFVQKTTAKAR